MAWKIGNLEIQPDYSNKPYRIDTKYNSEKEIWLNWNIKQFNFSWEDIPSSDEDTARLLDFIGKYYSKTPSINDKYKVEKIGKEIWLNWNIKQFNFSWEDIPSSDEDTARLLDFIGKYYSKLKAVSYSEKHMEKDFSENNDYDFCQYIDIIRISDDKRKSFYILLNKRKKRSVLYFENNRLFEFEVQVEDRKTKIYSRILRLKSKSF